jgi:3-hydroxyacyl-CoA dehydrogenase
MVERGWLGEKSGQGFYKRVKEGGESKVLALDWKTLEYRPRQKATLHTLEMARGVEDLGERLRTLLGAKDSVGLFYQRLLGDLFLYAAARVPEIADTVVEIDQAMRYGFNWERGPFELWDAIGPESILERWKSEKRALPPLAEELNRAPEQRFYLWQNNQRFYFDLERTRHRFVHERPGVILLADRRAAGAVVQSNAGASLIDLGDGVACLEFHTKMNAIGGDILEIARAALEALQAHFDGLVIGNQGPHFSAGANIMLLLMAAQEEEWDEIHAMVRAFQNTVMAFKYAPRPVVAAPHGMALGGGCEVVLHGQRVVAAAES